MKGRDANKHLKDFRLFAIMDTDDCTAKQKRDYISKDMFKGHWLHEYIVPIYNSEDLEDVIVSTGIMPKKAKKREKGSSYKDYFPVNDRLLFYDTCRM